ncbi:MAG: translation elongation factor Ts [Deltaproteobacteria bacterium]|jgi:elongation factor Ts|nr:translation elongation factor Ts [Deltaproteobacteria bacterium]
MEITAKMVKELREKTNAGMMDCKNALTSVSGDMEKARDWLRERGLATVSKRAGRTAKEGVIATSVSSDLKQAAIVELNTETDFVAKMDSFRKLANDIAKHLSDTKDVPVDLDSLLLCKCKVSKTSYGALITDNTAKTGEKSELRRFKVLKTKDKSIVHAYNHTGDKLGVILVLDVEKPGEDADQVAHDIAMQIAAHNPSAINVEDLPKEVIERETKIYTELIKNLEKPKPKEIWPKIIEGYLRDFYKQVVLNEQSFIKEPKLSVKAYLNSKKAQIGQASVRSFVRYQLAEELEGENA